MSIVDYHNTLRAEIGEEAYLARMAKIRASRRQMGGPWRLDYVDKDGRTGSEIATQAAKRGARIKASKQEKEL